MPRIRRRWAVWALVALLLAGCAGYASWRFLSVEAYLRDARIAQAHHNYLQARDSCDAYLQFWPTSADAHLLAARCARHLGDFDAAETHLAAARRWSKENASALALEGALLAVQRGVGSATDGLYLGLLVEHDRPETAEILETLTQRFLFNYRLGDALQTVDRWVARRPDDGQAFYLRGLVKEAMQQLDQARDDYRRAVALDPNNIEAGKRLGEALLTEGEAAEALKQFERLRPQAPDDPALQLGAARCQRHLGRTDEAFRILDALAARQPGNAVVWRERGSVALDQDRLAVAEASFQKALAADPFDDVTCSKLAACLRRLDRPSEADEVMQRGKRVEDDATRLQALIEQVGRRPTDPAPRCEAGLICMRNGQEKEGLRWLLGAVQTDPNYQPAHDALAAYYERQGNAK